MGEFSLPSLMLIDDGNIACNKEGCSLINRIFSLWLYIIDRIIDYIREREGERRREGHWPNSGLVNSVAAEPL